jgi:rod shape-determining protein MreD
MAVSDRMPGVRPNLTAGRRLDIAWRHAFPGLTSLLLMLLSLAHFGIWEQAALLPTVALTCVWFWSLFRPSAMAPPIVFLLGLFLDLLGFLPLGVGGVTMLATHGIAHWLRRFLSRQGFAVVWLIFTTVACVIAGLNWTLVSLLTFSLVPWGPVLFQAGLAAAMYPAVAIPLMLAHRSIANPDLA